MDVEKDCDIDFTKWFYNVHHTDSDSNVNLVT